MMTGGGGGGEWLTAKKRGRDDEQIERDRVAAVAARKKNKATKLGMVAKAAQKKETRTAGAAKKVSGKRKTSRTMDSLAGFVVEDGEENWEAGGVSSSDEEEELPDADDPPKRKGVKKSPYSDVDDDDDDDSGLSESDDTPNVPAKKRIEEDEEENSSDESGTFFGTFKKRTSKPPPRGKLLKRGPAVKSFKKEPAGVMRLSSDAAKNNDSKRLAAKKGGPKSTPVASIDDIDSDHGSIPFSKIDDKLHSILRNSSDEESLDSASKLFDDNNRGGKSKCFAKVLGELEDTPVVPSAIRKKVNKKVKKTITADDYCSDIDEAVAIACALEESSKSTNKVLATSSPGGSATNDPVVELPDVDNSSNDDEDPDTNAYVDDDDDDARAASSILATANELSAHVLQTMAGWSKGATDGIIVDGALALSTLGDNNNNNNADTDHTWITQDTMREILPDVTLSEYQLIGINWLALLHGMKCEVKGTTEHTNVNGILADGTLRISCDSRWVCRFGP